MKRFIAFVVLTILGIPAHAGGGGFASAGGYGAQSFAAAPSVVYQMQPQVQSFAVAPSYGAANFGAGNCSPSFGAGGGCNNFSAAPSYGAANFAAPARVFAAPSYGARSFAAAPVVVAPAYGASGGGFGSRFGGLFRGRGSKTVTKSRSVVRTR